MLRGLLKLLLITSILCSCATHEFEKTEDGILVALDKTKSGGASWMQLRFISDDIVQVLVYPTDERKEPLSLCVEDQEGSQIDLSIAENKESIVVSTKEIKLDISMPDGKITYFNKSGKVLLQENGRSLQPVSLPNDSGVSIKQNLIF